MEQFLRFLAMLKSALIFKWFSLLWFSPGFIWPCSVCSARVLALTTEIQYLYFCVWALLAARPAALTVPAACPYSSFRRLRPVQEMGSGWVFPHGGPAGNRTPIEAFMRRLHCHCATGPRSRAGAVIQPGVVKTTIQCFVCLYYYYFVSNHPAVFHAALGHWLGARGCRMEALARPQPGAL